MRSHYILFLPALPYSSKLLLCKLTQPFPPSSAMKRRLLANRRPQQRRAAQNFRAFCVFFLSALFFTASTLLPFFHRLEDRQMSDQLGRGSEADNLSSDEEASAPQVQKKQPIFLSQRSVDLGVAVSKQLYDDKVQLAPPPISFLLHLLISGPRLSRRPSASLECARGQGKATIGAPHSSTAKSITSSSMGCAAGGLLPLISLL